MIRVAEKFTLSLPRPEPLKCGDQVAIMAIAPRISSKPLLLNGAFVTQPLTDKSCSKAASHAFIGLLQGKEKVRQADCQSQ